MLCMIKEDQTNRIYLFQSASFTSLLHYGTSSDNRVSARYQVNMNANRKFEGDLR